ncbi:TonB-dependent receptor [Spirosoma radiotolerans]|uniref:TonB-dependent receptor n=1 Tax=Spirosoma radiotolerans TaxID=1379870 RepID=A0A0E3ZZK7_9BACT|nr:TonB-dependent receptor [Spirosoma radiotolerans]AKD57424.1 TonB-dependent receptor [Spirosoma radiotolerans]
MNAIKLLFSLVFSVIALTTQAQPTAVIRGHIQTADGNPVEAVTVSLKGKGQGALTNAKGDFSINHVKAGTYLLQVSAIGLKTVEQTVTTTGTESVTVDFTLSESASQLTEVTVNGSRMNRFSRSSSEYVSKMPLKNLENPQVYNTIGKELLTEQLVFSVDDAMRNAPGVQKMWEATGRAGDGGSYYNTRGFIVQSQLRNGLAGNVTSDIDAVNLEKLETIKGPSATLFGSALTSYGGLVNRVTKKPYETFGGEVTLSGGSYDFQRASLDVNTPLNKSRNLMLRVNTAFNHEGTFQTQGFSRRFALAPSLLFKPTDRLSIQLDAEIYRNENVGKQILFFYVPGYTLGATRADQLNVDYRNSYMGSGLTQQSRSTNLFGQVNYRISPSFTSSTNISTSHSFSDGFGPYFYLVPSVGGTLGTNSLVRADQSTRNSTNDVFEVQQLFNGDFRLGSLRNRIVVGLDYLHVNANQLFFGSTYDTVPVARDYDYSQFNGAALTALYATKAPDFTYPLSGIKDTYSAFVSDVLNLTDRFSVLAALRVDDFHNKGGLVGSAVAGFNQTAFSPKLGLVYQPIKDRVSVFANYQNSFNNQGIYNAYDVTDSDSLTQRFAKLERANQVEAGVKLNAFSGRLTTTISYYDIQVKDLLRTDPNPLAAAKFAQTQDGTQVSRGVEIDVIANPFTGFNVVAGFSYNDSKLTKADADVNGRRPSTASSPVLANLWLSYRFNSYGLRGLGFGFGGNYASDNKIQNSVSLGEFILPAYTVLNASAFYDRRKFRISAKVDNLTNQHYWIGYTTMNPQKLRSFAGSVAYKF